MRNRFLRMYLFMIIALALSSCCNFLSCEYLDYDGPFPAFPALRQLPCV